jgi:hypothetical protein
MIPLHRDPVYRFPFADARVVDRFHLDGAAEGSRATVLPLDGGGEPIAAAAVGPGGWVRLVVPLVVAAGGGFVVRVG